MENLPPDALVEVAAYFQALSEPTRLSILNFLRDGERDDD
ncbi:MAG: transcriptional regulator, partial [bacterium]